MAVDQTTQSESARLSASKDQYAARGVATSPILVERAQGARLTLDVLHGCLAEV